MSTVHTRGAFCQLAVLHSYVPVRILAWQKVNWSVSARTSERDISQLVATVSTSRQDDTSAVCTLSDAFKVATQLSNA